MKPITRTSIAKQPPKGDQGPKPSGRRFWQAVAGRDARYDGAFVYAVRSTGVYCRPSCPSRRPKRERVIFFAGPEAAERNGFRACRRCNPRNASAKTDSRLITEACRIFEQDSVEAIRIASIARQLNVSPFRLQRLFRRNMGISPMAYAQSIRLRRLKTKLHEGNDVTSAMYEAGYSSSSRLYEQSDRSLGMSPATYGRGGQGMEIGYSTALTPMGIVLVAGTTKGVSAIYLGDSEEHLAAELHREYPAATISRNPARVSQWVGELVRHLCSGQPNPDLPLDVKATAFQCRVWRALKQIPPGSTRTYGEIARAIGLPNGQRAVARACATNPAAILIPCHRVVREDGGLGGYRWGIKRKQALLATEAKSDARKSS